MKYVTKGAIVRRKIITVAHALGMVSCSVKIESLPVLIPKANGMDLASHQTCGNVISSFLYLPISQAILYSIKAISGRQAANEDPINVAHKTKTKQLLFVLFYCCSQL